MLLKLIFQGAAESYAERSESPECLWFSVRQDIHFTVLACSPQGYLLSFWICLFDLGSMSPIVDSIFNTSGCFNQRAWSSLGNRNSHGIAYSCYSSLSELVPFLGRDQSLGLLWPSNGPGNWSQS